MHALLAKYGYPMNKPAAYLQNYAVWFAPLRDRPIRLLELGVDRGGSLLLWRDYFQHGVIVGLDATLAKMGSVGRVHAYQGRQENVETLEWIGLMHGPFDIVIDDCSHLAAPTRTSFWYLFEHHLKLGGLYIVEDWGTGYWDTWPDGSSKHDAGMVAFVKDLVDECGAADREAQGPVLVDTVSRFERMHVSFGQVLVEKKRTDGE